MECKKIVFIIALYTKFYKIFLNMGINTGFMHVQDSHTPYPYVHETLSFNPPGSYFQGKTPRLKISTKLLT